MKECTAVLFPFYSTQFGSVSGFSYSSTKPSIQKCARSLRLFFSVVRIALIPISETSFYCVIFLLVLIHGASFPYLLGYFWLRATHFPGQLFGEDSLSLRVRACPLERTVCCRQVARAATDQAHFKLNSQLGIFLDLPVIWIWAAVPLGWNGLYLALPYPEGVWSLWIPALQRNSFLLKAHDIFQRTAKPLFRYHYAPIFHFFVWFPSFPFCMFFCQNYFILQAWLFRIRIIAASCDTLTFRAYCCL